MDRCIRCDGELEAGFLLDRGDYNVTSQTQWTSGLPNTSFWRMSAAKVGERILPVTTFRCKGCGRLESFAPPAT